VRLSALAEGQWTSDVRVRLWRPGSISGVVRDEQGEALVGVPVRILAGVTAAGRLRWAAGVVTQTDDRGMYRFAGLQKGQYLVHVPSIQSPCRPAKSRSTAPRHAAPRVRRRQIRHATR
jgi:hypothetical protein